MAGKMAGRMAAMTAGRRLRGGLLLLASGGALFGVGALGLDRLSFLFCGFRALTGIPCPLCFGTRAAFALSQGDILDALALNPLVAVGFGATLLTGLILLAGGAPPWLAPRRQRPVAQVALVLLGINWIYRIALTP